MCLKEYRSALTVTEEAICVGQTKLSLSHTTWILVNNTNGYIMTYNKTQLGEKVHDKQQERINVCKQRIH